MFSKKLQLTVSQRIRLAELERRSFYKYCERLGCSPTEQESLLLRLEKEKINEICNATAVLDPKAAVQYREAVQAYLDVPDWWTYKRLTIRAKVEEYVADIAQHRRSLSINWGYLQSISSDLGMQSPREDSDESLAQFLLGIPHIMLYGMEFNAFVHRDAMVDDIPCVCVYELLVAAMERFLDVVIMQMFRRGPDNSATLVAGESVEVGAEPGYIEACREAFEFILCRKNFAAHEAERLASRSWPEMQMPWQLLASGANSFVCNHEYGHLLMGHLMRTGGHQLEFEADSFAWELLTARYEEETHRFYYTLGGLSVLLALAFIEKIERCSESQSHPCAEERISNLLRKAGDEGPRLALYLMVMADVCQTTAVQHSGIHAVPRILDTILECFPAGLEPFGPL